MTLHSLRLFGALFIFAFPFSMLCEVADASDFHSPRTDALGGAGHASPLLGDALYLNPSFSSFMKTHSFSANYLLFNGGTTIGPGGPTDVYGHNLNVSVLDGTAESMFQAGVGYTRRDDVSMLHLGASKSFFERLGVGIGTKFIFPSDGSGSRYVDATLSVSGLVATWFQTAFIVDNLFETLPGMGFNREFVLGTKINAMSILLLYLDPHWAPNLPNGQAAWGFESGAEFPFFNELFLRIGAFQNSNIPYQAQRGNGYGAGVGWLAPKLSLDYGFSRVITPILCFSHNIGVTIYF
jgi:hypothetical protein